MAATVAVGEGAVAVESTVLMVECAPLATAAPAEASLRTCPIAIACSRAVSAVELFGDVQMVGLGAPPDVDGMPDMGGVKVPFPIGVRLATDAGDMFVVSLGEGGLGRLRVRCRKIAGCLLAAQLSVVWWETYQ